MAFILHINQHIYPSLFPEENKYPILLNNLNPFEFHIFSPLVKNYKIYRDNLSNYLKLEVWDLLECWKCVGYHGRPHHMLDVNWEWHGLCQTSRRLQSDLNWARITLVFLGWLLSQSAIDGGRPPRTITSNRNIYGISVNVVQSWKDY